MKAAEYTVEEMRTLLKNMEGMYDLARVVDPIECRIFSFLKDGTVSLEQKCYGIWNAESKCTNCSSAMACRTGCHQEKEEFFEDNIFHIQSNPIKLKLPDGGAYDAVMELVSIEKDAPNNGSVNDRAAENDDYRASRYQAAHDSMTKVLNAEAFYELAREQIVENPDRSWVLVTGNIMDFRLVNTLFGDVRGNEVLARTAGLLKRAAEESGGLCGRLGGDQFALLLPRDAYREETLLDIRRELSAAFSCGVYTFVIHFGVYHVADPSVPVSVMCGRANSALRTIRESLRDTVATFDADMMKQTLFEQQVISGFEEALRGDQFRMYLQPLAHADGRIFGAEALVRWHRPDGTVVMPGDFIEILEQAGLVQDLDRYIWECAVKQLKKWEGTDKSALTISVNMSALDFFNIDVYRVMTELVEKYGVDSSKLRLEITETALLEEPESSAAIIRNLQEKGFVVEIDDFGKGHSSLRTLKDIQADVLKIDMSLLQEIESRERSRVILEAIINLADSLGMDVITEGVETKAQLQTLSAMGCRHFQGFYFSRPVSVEDFEAGFSEANAISETEREREREWN